MQEDESGENSDSIEDEDCPCLCHSCPVESSRDNKCCQYFAKCKLDCESANIDCVTNLPKLMKMMDEVHIFMFYFFKKEPDNSYFQDVLEFTLHCYYDVLRTNYASPPQNRLHNAKKNIGVLKQNSIGHTDMLPIGSLLG